MSNEIRSLFSKIWETKEGFRTYCPACGDRKGVFNWNESKGVGCCFHEDCIWFFKKGGATAYRLLAYLGKKAPEFGPPEVIEQAEKADVKLPEEFELLDDLPESLRDSIFAYMDSRHITKHILRRQKIGYCQSGRFWGYMIFPVFNQDREVVYWQGRRFKKREPKFYNPYSSHKSELVYWVGKGIRPKRIIIVESIINALTLDSGLGASNPTKIAGIFGKSLSDDQKQLILCYERSLDEIVIFYDGDAWRDAVQTANKLQGAAPRVGLIETPMDQDVNSLGKEASWDMIGSPVVYRQENHISLMLRSA